MTRSQRSTHIRWADSDSRIRSRRDFPGFGRLSFCGAGGDTEPQPSIVPKWVSGQVPKAVGHIDFASVQMLLA